MRNVPPPPPRRLPYGPTCCDCGVAIGPERRRCWRCFLHTRSHGRPNLQSLSRLYRPFSSVTLILPPHP